MGYYEYGYINNPQNAQTTSSPLLLSRFQDQTEEVPDVPMKLEFVPENADLHQTTSRSQMLNATTGSVFVY